MHDPWLSRGLRRALLAALAVPTLAACSGSGREVGGSLGETGACDPVPDDAPHGCSTGDYTVTIAQGTLTCARQDGGGLTTDECRRVCSFGSGLSGDCSILSDSTISCRVFCPVDGRRPRGLAAPTIAASTALGAHFAAVAHMEAASIDAFAILAGELEDCDAPAALIAAARQAACDEVAHARTTTALARRFGAEPPVPMVAPHTPRSLEALAIENEIEGCVRETFSALQAMHQAQCAEDPVVRRAMARIAIEEEQHAALAWAISTWARTRLDVEACARLDMARTGAIATLQDELRHEPAADVVARAGVPCAKRAADLVAEARRAVWSAAA